MSERSNRCRGGWFPGWWTTQILSSCGLILFLLAAHPLPSRAAPAAPTITADNAIVLDPDSGRELFAQGSRARVAPASLTKIMTALVALEEADPARQITILPEDLIGEASMGLRAGERLSLETLLYGLMLPSGNDAAMAVARGVGARPGDRSGAAGVARFVGWMNEAATRIDLGDTQFANPHGLDADGHWSSAYDLARLTGFAWQQPTFARIFGSASYEGEGHALRHGNRLIGQYDGVAGGKTGLTDGCGFCLVTAATHAGHRLVVVVLRDTRAGAFADTTALLDWSYAQLDLLVQAVAQPPPTPAPIPATPVSSVALVAVAPVGAPLTAGVRSDQPALLPVGVLADARAFDGQPAFSPVAALGVLGLLAVICWTARAGRPDVARR